MELGSNRDHLGFVDEVVQPFANRPWPAIPTKALIRSHFLPMSWLQVGYCCLAGMDIYRLQNLLASKVVSRNTNHTLFTSVA